MDDITISQLCAEQFPSLRDMIYANHAAISPWPRVTSEAVSRFARENCDSGPLGTGQWLITENRLRQRIASLLNAESGDDIALLKNTTEGINAVANGFDWQSGDNVVTTAEEFVSNQMAWDALQDLGVEVRRVPVLHSKDPESDLIHAIDERTRVLTVSSVQWDNGFRLDLEALGKACEPHPAVFFVDAIQQFPAIPIDVRACRIDALAASAHKWQMGPEGIAVFYCNRACREKLGLAQHGWRMLDDPYRFERPDRTPSSSARRFEAGSPNTLGQTALFASLGLFCEVGTDQVARRIGANTAQIMEALSSMPRVQINSRTESGRRSGIVSFSVEGLEPVTLRRNLSRQKVFVAVRGPAIRLSPHFYQSAEHMEKMLESIRAAIDK